MTNEIIQLENAVYDATALASKFVDQFSSALDYDTARRFANYERALFDISSSLFSWLADD